MSLSALAVLAFAEGFDCSLAEHSRRPIGKASTVMAESARLSEPIKYVTQGSALCDFAIPFAEQASSQPL